VLGGKLILQRPRIVIVHQDERTADGQIRERIENQRVPLARDDFTDIYNGCLILDDLQSISGLKP
jgi:hypothetical protein